MASGTDQVRETRVDIPPAKQSSTVDVTEKGLCTAYILWIPPLGLLGLHQFYLGRRGWGVTYLFTLGLLGVGWLYDVIRMPRLVSVVNKDNNDKAYGHPPLPLKHLEDAYLLCIPLGWLGLHYFYLKKPGWGWFYSLTFGVFFIGWLVDLFRLPSMVETVNESILTESLELYQPTAYASKTTQTPNNPNDSISTPVTKRASVHPKAGPYETAPSTYGSVLMTDQDGGYTNSLVTTDNER